MPNSKIEYALEIYKPPELQRLPAVDECRHYHSDQPFPAYSVGDELTAWVWHYSEQDEKSFTREMGRTTHPEPMEPIAIISRVMHAIYDEGKLLRCTTVVFTKMHPKAQPVVDTFDAAEFANRKP